MTPEQLDAIRARDALTPKRWFPNQLPAERQARIDRRALLAEVDRLTLAVAIEKAGASSDVKAEHARIRRKVEGLPFDSCGGWGCSGQMADLRAAVLAIVEGEA